MVVIVHNEIMLYVVILDSIPKRGEPIASLLGWLYVPLYDFSPKEILLHLVGFSIVHSKFQVIIRECVTIRCSPLHS